MNKTKNIFFTSLIAIMAIFCALPVMAAIDQDSSETSTISSTVYISNERGKIESAAGVTVCVVMPNSSCDPTSSTITEGNGKFTISPPANATGVKLSSIGLKTKEIAINNNFPKMIYMSTASSTIDDVVVSADTCTQTQLKALHATKGIVYEEKCIPMECITPRYNLANEQTKDNGDGTTSIIGGECIDTQGTPCNPKPENAKIAHMENGKCVIKQCNEPQYRLTNGECVDMVGKDCTAEISHAVTATYQIENNKLVCRVDKCDEPGYVPNEKKTKCEESDGPCTDTQIKAIEHATSGSLRKGKCIITACEKGYHPSKDGTKCEQAELSEEGSKAQIKDLKDNAQKMKDKEQSTANKTLGAAAIGATGIGGMQLMEGLAEQKADNAAEEDMKAYLATFVCDYGQGRNIKGGETAIEVPGGNELIAQVTEYKALAADLKARKEALGKQPGIESEVIFDTAETGLYDNVGMGRQSGAYTSLSRALTDETSADAEAWAKQKADAASKVKTGAIVAGAGAVGGLIGNLAINSGDKKKNKVDEILNKREYDKFQQLKPILNELDNNIPSNYENTAKCTGNATGTPPNCQCSNPDQVYSSAQGCITCDTNEEPDATQTACVCKNGFSGTPCVKNEVSPNCELTAGNRGNVTVDPVTGICTCTNGYPDVPTCACDTTAGKWTYTDGKCNEVATSHPAPSANISGTKSMFAVNKSDLTVEAKQALDGFITNFNRWLTTNQPASYCIKIDGHTDLTGSQGYNKNLSQKRADSVKDYLSQKQLDRSHIKATGHGWDACVDQNGTKLIPNDQPDCRKIVVEVDYNNCDSDAATSTTNSADTNAIATATTIAQDTTCNQNARWNKLTCNYNSGQPGICPYRYGAGIHQAESRDKEPYKSAFAELTNLCRQAGGSILIAEQTLSDHTNVCGNSNNKYDAIYCVYTSKNDCEAIQTKVRTTTYYKNNLLVEANSTANYTYNGKTYASACQFNSPYKQNI